MAFRLTRAPAALLRYTPTCSRLLHASAPRLAMSEHDTHKGKHAAAEDCSAAARAQAHDAPDSDQRKTEIDGHKDDSLAKQKDGKAHWKHELASSSEAAVCVPVFWRVWGKTGD